MALYLFKVPKDVHPNERWFTIAFQVFIPYIIAGFGMVGAGLVLDKVQVSLLTVYKTAISQHSQEFLIVY
jgi:hypothetical protein